MYSQTTRRLILAEGETSGHKHVLTANVNIEYEKKPPSTCILLTGTGILMHDEHDRMIFNAGKYRCYNQVEFNPMDGSVNRIFD
ncbi:MAG: hypothetical protein J0I32_09465 [Sphingobacteriales bacterium]|nr:hypothetical protein [Sphingobacteriales bacterium]OJW00226.1 MAG: hypothetical protein BGO52_03835 [Sphingobacteriales bacterium 44-61]